MINKKYQFTIPAVIFTVAVVIMMTYGFIHAQTAWLRATPEPTLQSPGNALIKGVLTAEGGLVIEARTSDPASPASGRMWLRTDL